MVPMTLRAVKPQHETRTRILDAAEELFMQHGFEGTSMRLLTAKAGVNLAAVNYHFGSKDALIEAVFHRRLDPMKVALERALPQMPRDELVWRMHFMFGTLAYTLAATDTVQLIAGCKPEDRYDARLLEERLTAFLAAGLTAPLKNVIRKAA